MPEDAASTVATLRAGSGMEVAGRRPSVGALGCEEQSAARNGRKPHARRTGRETLAQLPRLQPRVPISFFYLDGRVAINGHVKTATVGGAL